MMYSQTAGIDYLNICDDNNAGMKNTNVPIIEIFLTMMGFSSARENRARENENHTPHPIFIFHDQCDDQLRRNPSNIQ